MYFWVGKEGRREIGAPGGRVGLAGYLLGASQELRTQEPTAGAWPWLGARGTDSRLPSQKIPIYLVKRVDPSTALSQPGTFLPAGSAKRSRSAVTAQPANQRRTFGHLEREAWRSHLDLPRCSGPLPPHQSTLLDPSSMPCEPRRASRSCVAPGPLFEMLLEAPLLVSGQPSPLSPLE